MTARPSPLKTSSGRWSAPASPKPAIPIQFVWSKIGNFKIDGNTITADVKEFDPTLFKWMAFLTGYVLPKAYYKKVGAEGFEAAPIGTGPYMVEKFERNAFVRLKANPNYWGGKPAFDTVIIKFVHRCDQPRRGDRIRQVAGHASTCPMRNMTA